MSMLEDPVGRRASQERGDVRVVAKAQDPRVRQHFRQQCCIAKPTGLCLLRRPGSVHVAVQAVDCDDAAGVVMD